LSLPHCLIYTCNWGNCKSHKGFWKSPKKSEKGAGPQPAPNSCANLTIEEKRRKECTFT
jgi:hypothetical protein